MIDVVFNDSEKGSMRAAQHFKKEIGGVTSVLTSDGKQLSQEEYDAALAEINRRMEQEWREGKPLGGNPEDVIGLPFVLDMGDISTSVTDPSRKEFITQMFTANPWDEFPDMEDSINPFWESCISDLHKLTVRARAGESVRIWYSDAPYSMCGFYHTASLLKDFECHVLAVKLPTYMPRGEQEVESAVFRGEISPGKFAQYLTLETEIPHSMQKAIAMEWEQLKRENAPLRVVLNGRLHSVGLDFYDGFIRKEIPEGTFKVGQLIGFVLGRNRLGIGDWLIAQRVHTMIESGELKVVQENPAFYGTLLKRNL